MATYYSQGSSNWSTLANWNTNRGGGGSSPASVAAMDNNTFVIQASHNICFDIDSSGWANGFNTVTIEGGATPGMVYSKYDADGTYYFKIKTGTTLGGTTSTNRGRLLANSDGVWANSTALPFGRKFIIDLITSAYINASNLDVKLICAEPTITEVGTYGTKNTASSIDVSTDKINFSVAHGWASNTPLMVKSSGDLPSPLVSNKVYYLQSSGTTWIKLSDYTSGSAIDLTTSGSGTIEVYSGHTSTSTATINVLTDATGDSQWAGTAVVALVDSFAPEAKDVQFSTISSVAAGSITLGNNVDSVQYPGSKIVLLQRNVAIRNNQSSYYSAGLLNYSFASTHGAILQCEIRNTAAAYERNGINYGVGHAVTGGVISGLSIGINYVTTSTINTIICCCYSGIVTTSGYSGSTFSGTVLGCTYGVQSGDSDTYNFNTYGCTTGLVSLTSCTINGNVIGCQYGVSTSSAITVNGNIYNCYYGFNYVDGTTNGEVSGCQYGFSETFMEIKGNVHGCYYGAYKNSCRKITSYIYQCIYGMQECDNCVIDGGVYSCTFGIYGGNDNVLYGKLGYGQTGEAASNTYDFSFLDDYSVSKITSRGALHSTPPSIFYTNSEEGNTNTVFFCEDYGRVTGASCSFRMGGSITKNTSTLNTSGTSSLECVPRSVCSSVTPLPLFSWTELNVPTGSRTKSVYISGSNWSSFPTTGELYIQAEYLNTATGVTRSTVYSTGILSSGIWNRFSVTFSPSQVGIVRYEGYLKKYISTAKIYIDTRLY